MMDDRPTLTDRARQAHEAEQAAERARQQKEQAAERARQQEAGRAYQQLRDTVTAQLVARFGVDPKDVHVRGAILRNGIDASDRRPADALVVAVDGLTMVAGDCTALAMGSGTFSVHLTERRVDTASGYPYWSATSRDLTDLAALGRALYRQGTTPTR